MRRESGGFGRPREARLRSASAHLFPGVPAEIWIQAAVMADIVAAKRLQRGNISLADRVLDPAHFEFRQGRGQEGPEAPLRRRATDSLRLQGD
jgi:hypothetical protein